jgi:hypothetical protein
MLKNKSFIKTTLSKIGFFRKLPLFDHKNMYLLQIYIQYVSLIFLFFFIGLLNLYAQETLITIDKNKKIDTSVLLYDHTNYNPKFVNLLFENEFKVQVLDDWFYPNNIENSIPLYFSIPFENGTVHILKEYEYRIIYLCGDKSHDFTQDKKSITLSIGKILSKVQIDDDSLTVHQQGIYSAYCVDSGEGRNGGFVKYVIWNKSNWIHVMQKLVARQLDMIGPFQKSYRHSGQVGLSTMKDDQNRSKKLTKWVDFIPENVRQSFNDDFKNACVWPTESAGKSYELSSGALFYMSPSLQQSLKRPWRNWSIEGNRKGTEAKYMGSSGSQVILRKKSDGSEIKINIDSLSKQDQKYIEDIKK